MLKEHLRRYSDDILMCDAAFSLYLSLVKIPKHESDSGDLVPFSAGMQQAKVGHQLIRYNTHSTFFSSPTLQFLSTTTVTI